MPRIAWFTDIHLNFLLSQEYASFLRLVEQTDADAIVLTGDIGEAHSVVSYLRDLARVWQKPLYFVLGNHDYYFGSIRQVQSAVQMLCRQKPELVFLTCSDAHELAPGVGICGHDGWGDGRAGSYERSLVEMRDYQVIEELTGYTKEARWEVLKQLGDEAGNHVRRVLPPALEKYDRVFFATHVPPLREACWHEGMISDEHWSPHFTCLAVGKALLEVMAQFPKKQLTVLCGHTHGAGRCQPAPNLEILTGGALYGAPALVREFEV